METSGFVLHSYGSLFSVGEPVGTGKLPCSFLLFAT